MPLGHRCIASAMPHAPVITCPPVRLLKWRTTRSEAGIWALPVTSVSSHAPTICSRSAASLFELRWMEYAGQGSSGPSGLSARPCSEGHARSSRYVSLASVFMTRTVVLEPTTSSKPPTGERFVRMTRSYSSIVAPSRCCSSRPDEPTMAHDEKPSGRSYWARMAFVWPVRSLLHQSASTTRPASNAVMAARCSGAQGSCPAGRARRPQRRCLEVGRMFCSHLHATATLRSAHAYCTGRRPSGLLEKEVTV